MQAEKDLVDTEVVDELEEEEREEEEVGGLSN